MEQYIDIKLKPDVEIRESPLMNKVYSKLHKRLVSLHSDSIGVSFPEFHIKLGRLLRLHGDGSVLRDFQAIDWIGGLSGYCEVSAVLLAPSSKKYRVISRIQSNMTQSKLNRLIKRGSIKEDDIKKYKAKMFGLGLDNPYLDLESGSNGHQHRRFLKFGNIIDSPQQGTFDTFGLSKIATVPWF